MAENSAGAIQQIWVSEGNYVPSRRTNPDDPRSATFQLVGGVSIFEGFDGTEDSIDGRVIEAHPTVLSGDLSGDDLPGFLQTEDIAQHVVTAIRAAPGTQVNGFIVQGGNASDSDDGRDRGGGLYISDCALVIRDCTFRENSAGTSPYGPAFGTSSGGAVYVESTTTWKESELKSLFVDCAFSGNLAFGVGGGLYAVDASVEVFHGKFTENRAYDGGALAVYGSSDSTFEANHFTANRAAYAGGAVSIDAGASILLTGCHFRENRADWSEGAIEGRKAHSMRVEACVFEENPAESMAGAILGRLYADIVSCTFRRNSAELGGAVHTYFSTVHLSDCRFFSNWATLGGGAIGGGWLDISDCYFDDNDGGQFGGAILATYDSETQRYRFLENRAVGGGAIHAAGREHRIIDSEFDANYADFGGALAFDDYGEALMDRCEDWRNGAEVGDGIFVTGDDSSLALVSSLVAGNRADAYGGGIASGSGSTLLGNCTIAQNQADALGAGLIAGDGAVIRNSIVWGNAVSAFDGPRTDEAAQFEGIELTEISYSDVQGWTGEFGGDGNFGLDPLFVSPNEWWSNYIGDFRLQPDSPCFNAGLAETIDWGPWNPPPNLDLDGKPRVLCGLIDLGAYEFGLTGDVDCDQRFDLDDLAYWPECALGPAVVAPCNSFDTDGDFDVDLQDFAALQGLMEP